MSTPKKDTRFTLASIALLLVVLAVWYWAGKYFWPTREPVDREKQKDALVVASAVSGLAHPEGQPWNALGSLGALQAALRGEWEKPKEPEAPRPKEKPKEKPREKPAPVPEENIPDEWKKVVTLGAPGSHLKVKLNPQGAGVQQIVLPHFQAADPETGEPVWLLDPETGKPLRDASGHKIPKPLELVPENKNREIASFLLYHYADAKGDDFPLDTLGKRVWKRVEPEEVKDGEAVQRAVYETEVQGVRITKTYTLEPRDYHIGLEVKLELADPQAKERTFRYQFTGPHGLAIEGQWYTSFYRNALIGQVDEKGNVERKLQELREISLKAGGDEVMRGDKPIRYAIVSNQFFASGIAVATKDQESRDFLGQARPILMESAVKGTVKPSENPDEVVIDAAGSKITFVYAGVQSRKALEDKLLPGREVIIVHRSVIDLNGKSREVITGVLDPDKTAPIFHDDITVEVRTPRDDKILKLKPGAAVVHKYVLYNGPLKVRLLGDLKLDAPAGDEGVGAPAVDPAMVTYYEDDLHLGTLTDYPTSWMGRAFSTIGVTQVVIWFTNRMHDILWILYRVVKVLPETLVYGVCILLLTVLVRGAMHPVSRKQARTTMRMQSLQPELQKLKEKHKDDKQALQMAQMELYRKHGINPLGSCWMMFLQMPVFLGLYYCLQESIHFRLKPFLWIKSLTAPDMLWHWGDKIPFISDWQHYGAMYYLGPYFNVLPVIAVVLMIFQQKLTMPPPGDEQQEMQQKVMKWSMILFGLFFYKVAAGLCLYFIASSLWGFAERKLLPKKKPDGTPPVPPTPGRATLMQRLLDRVMDAQRPQTGGNGAAPAPAPGGGGKRKRGRPAAAGAASAPDGLLARVRAWWAEVLKQAAKK